MLVVLLPHGLLESIFDEAYQFVGRSPARGIVVLWLRGGGDQDLNLGSLLKLERLLGFEDAVLVDRLDCYHRLTSVDILTRHTNSLHEPQSFSLITPRGGRLRVRRGLYVTVPRRVEPSAAQIDLSGKPEAIRNRPAEERFSRHVTIGGYPSVWLSETPETLLSDLVVPGQVRRAKGLERDEIFADEPRPVLPRPTFGFHLRFAEEGLRKPLSSRRTRKSEGDLRRRSATESG